MTVEIVDSNLGVVMEGVVRDREEIAETRGRMRRA
jgi:hypothetical protein